MNPLWTVTSAYLETLMKPNPENERVKREYFRFLKEAKRQNEATIDMVSHAIHQFETHTRFKNFKLFHIEQAISFKTKISGKNTKDGRKLSKATINSILGHLKRFFQWLSQKSGYKSRISYADAEYFSLSNKDLGAAKTSQPKKFPTLEQITHVLNVIPSETAIDLRNRAVIAFTILTGARDNATASLSLKHVDIEKCCLYQDAREVNTKFSKSFPTYFFPVEDEILQIFNDWVNFLRIELSWGENDPLFPATDVQIGKNNLFMPVGLKRVHWSNASPIRNIFKIAFQKAGLPYYNPHSFRSTLVAFGMDRCDSALSFKAVSQNLGHEKVLTTFNSYGHVSEPQQAEIIRNLSIKMNSDDLNDQQLLQRLAVRLKKDKE